MFGGAPQSPIDGHLDHEFLRDGVQGRLRDRAEVGGRARYGADFFIVELSENFGRIVLANGQQQGGGLFRACQFSLCGWRGDRRFSHTQTRLVERFVRRMSDLTCAGLARPESGPAIILALVRIEHCCFNEL